MKQVPVSPREPSSEPDRSDEGVAPAATQLPLWQVNLLRVGYFFMGAGLAVVKWPLLFTHGPWGLKDGTVECMLVAISLLALMGIRHPVRMLPVLLFEVTWKLTWLAVIAAPLWLDDKLAGSTREQAGTVLWVIIIIAVIPWRYVFAHFVTAPGDPWRRHGKERRTRRTQGRPARSQNRQRTADRWKGLAQHQGQTADLRGRGK